MSTKKRVAPNNIQEYVAYACVAVINNRHGREIERLKEHLARAHQELEASRETAAKYRKLDGKLVRLCYRCGDLEEVDSGRICQGCSQWTCDGCGSSCDGCDEDFCIDCIQECQGGVIITCRDNLCSKCVCNCEVCGSEPFCRDHAADCCPMSSSSSSSSSE